MTDPFERIANSPLASFVLNVASGGALLVMAAWFSYIMFSSREIDMPPRIVNTIAVEPTILLAGKPFKTTVNVTLNKLCPYEVHWSLVRTDNNLEVVKLVEPVKQPPPVIGTQDLPPIIRYIPNSVEPGEYKFISEVYDQCPDGHTYTSVRHNVSLTVR
jgi:hypothetical protein